MIRLLTLLSSLVFAGCIYADREAWQDREEVSAFIKDMVKQYQFKQEALATLFNQIEVRPIIFKKNNVPIEAKPWYLYQLMFVTDKRIQDGLNFWQLYEKDLARAEKVFGVPASVIVATIGIESKYGRESGKYRVMDALVNLAFDLRSKRRAYFRKELVDFLLLTREQHLDPLSIKGSYAGAIGQPQFMPSSYRHYAVNFSGNSTIDLSHNEVDVIGSIANFYKKNGWKNNEVIAMPVSKAGGRFQYPVGKKSISFAEIMNIGIGPNAMETVKGNYHVIALQQNYRIEYWKLFHNFNVIRRYNHSDLYAMSVFQLSFFINAIRGNQLCLTHLNSS